MIFILVIRLNFPACPKFEISCQIQLLDFEGSEPFCLKLVLSSHYRQNEILSREQKENRSCRVIPDRK